MPSSELKQVEVQLKALERRSTWMWSLAAVVMVALTLTLLSLLMAPESAEHAQPTDSRYLLTIGFSGLVALFSLYMLLKQSEMHALRFELFQMAMRGELIRSRLAELSSLFEGLACVGMKLELKPVLQTLAEQVQRTLGGQQSSILLLDPEQAELRCVAASGEGSEFVRDAVKVGADIAGWVVEHNQALLLTPEEMAQRFPTVHKPDRNIASSMCIPLAQPDRVIGVLNISRSADAPPFTSDDLAPVTVFGAHIAIAIERMREQEQMQRALAQHEERLRQMQKMDSLGRLAGGVAHDFNNLLTVIVAHTAMLLRGQGEGDPTRLRLEKVADAASRCVSLTRQLLTFSRKEMVELRALDLNACLEGASDLLQKLIGEDVEFVISLGSGLGRLRGDEVQIQRILMNLAVNAREAMPTGGRITIHTENVAIDPATAALHLGAQAGPYVVLSFEDTGRGMNEETQARLFEPFFTTKPLGTGLGLSTVYGIVQQCGGFITVESQPGRGTKLRIHFPRIDQTLADSAHLVTSPTPADDGAPGNPSPGATILLVEDQADVRELASQILHGGGYRVIEARWGGEAALIAEAHSQVIDLMLTDVVMPEQSGGELARWMSEIRPDVPVLFMSGYPDDEIVRRGVQTGIASFLRKPFTPEALLEKVSACLTAHSSGSEATADVSESGRRPPSPMAPTPA